MILSDELVKYMKRTELTEQKREYAKKLIKSLGVCSCSSLYGAVGNDIELITSIACSHKLCNICNWNRQKQIRRKYYRWFGENEKLAVMFRDGARKVTTAAQREKWESAGYVFATEVKYDLMHLTLTVPHTEENGWRGKEFYFKELTRAFNFMRKSDDWLRWVYGGEYGVEVTKGENGYHIHIHALLFVRKATRNRDKLHKVIFESWNRLTVDSNSHRKLFDDKEIESIKKGNKLFDDDFISKLNPRGATLIGLENIFTINNNGEKVRVGEWCDSRMMKAVMETISYHFKPKMLEKKDGNHDMENLVNILEAVHNQRLYDKFGCLYGEKSLNLKDDSLLQDFEEVKELIDEETGEIFAKRYFITNPVNLYHIGDGDAMVIKMRKNATSIELGERSTRGAIEVLVQKLKNRHNYAM
ncbi:protein rep [Bacteroidales bacterium OttesenSCG-928-B11]|nr:protein rep [Bacteroidales bacterium OttesenSCG-928-B11]